MGALHHRYGPASALCSSAKHRGCPFLTGGFLKGGNTLECLLVTLWQNKVTPVAASDNQPHWQVAPPRQ